MEHLSGFLSKADAAVLIIIMVVSTEDKCSAGIRVGAGVYVTLYCLTSHSTAVLLVPHPHGEQNCLHFSQRVSR